MNLSLIFHNYVLIILSNTNKNNICNFIEKQGEALE